MGWFLVVQQTPAGTMKLIRYGTGSEVDGQLFDLTSDPNETKNLIHDPKFAGIVKELEESLRSVINYPKVAMEVAHYNKASFEGWINSTKDWKTEIHNKNLRWTQSWDEAGEHGAMDAIEKWLSAPAEVLPCRPSLIWPSGK